MRIYVACLASYNAGCLHGTWIDASEDVSEMQKAINDMLRKSPYPNVTRADYHCPDCDTRTVTESFRAALPPSIECEECGEPAAMVGEPYKSAEEWAIHDYEGLGRDLGEYAGLETVARRVIIANAADEVNIPVDVLIEAMRDFNCEPEDEREAEDFISDRYRGTYDSWADMAQELTEETHDMSELPEWVRGHIDWESVGRDFEHSGDFSAYEHNHERYFFWAH